MRIMGGRNSRGKWVWWSGTMVVMAVDMKIVLFGCAWYIGYEFNMAVVGCFGR